MLLEIVEMLAGGFNAVSGWFLQIVDKLGVGGLIIAAFVIYQSFRLLLAPLVGQASSDKARKRKGDSDP